MGCHTWFYKKMEKQPSYEKCKNAVLLSCKENIKYLEHLKKGLAHIEELDEYDKDCIRVNKYTPKKVKFEIKVWKRKIEKINQDKCPEAVKKRYPHLAYVYENTGLIVYHKGIFYWQGGNKEEEKKLPHNIFRIHNFPLDKLTSYEEFENFYNTHDCFPPDDNDVRSKMMEFWEKYPDGMVDFG